MFIGKYYNCIDDKNRMTIPAKYRPDLEPRCILAKGNDYCLVIYTMEKWQETLKELDGLPQSDPDVREYIRYVTSNAVLSEMDKQGRILIPADHRAFAGISKELVTAGAGEKIEVWSKENWTEPEQSPDFDPRKQAQKMGKYGI